MDIDERRQFPTKEQLEEQAAARQEDIHDSPRDEERLKPDEATLDLPDVSDIPGQEHVTVLPLGELADDTASSDDEEGDELLGE